MKTLLSPGRIGTCLLKNRIVLTAASLCRSPQGNVTEELLDFYGARARGGTGLLIAGAAGVDPVRRSKGNLMQACDDTFLPDLCKVAENIHREGGKTFLQLYHPGAYASPLEYGDTPPLAPSAYRSGLTRVETVAMTVEEIHTVTGYFVDGAVRAKKAGFDGVELCASVGYLLAEFLSSATNHRTDQYGISLQNRMRFLLEIVDGIQKTLGADFPLLVRLSGMDMIPGGNTLSDTVEIAKALERHGVDGISVTGGWHESKMPQITGQVPHGGYAFLSKAIKAAVSIPVIASNRMDWESGQQALSAGSCDFVGMCRPLIADPDLVNKAAQDQVGQIRRCLSCNQECLDRVFADRPVGCAVNPRIGRELSPPVCREQGKRILVVGAGISGMTYAAFAAKQNQVTIFEQSGTYGGVGKILSHVPGWADCRGYLDSLYRTCLQAGVVFQFGRSVTAAELETMVSDDLYDKIIVAAGAVVCAPSFPISGNHVIRCSALTDTTAFPTGRTVFIGNDFRGLELSLACAKKRADQQSAQRQFLKTWCPEIDVDAVGPDGNVTCIGPLKKPGAGMAKSVLWVALLDAKERNVQLIAEATVTGVTNAGVFYNKDGKEQFCPADTVVLAQGFTANDQLCPDRFSPEARKKMVWIGDVKGPGKIPEAVRSGAKAALTDESVQ